MEKKLNVQILRVIACLGVFAVHFGQRIGGPLASITNFGQYGVELFFIISGYLAFASLKKENPDSLGLYYKKRAIRLLPLYFIAIVFYAITESLVWKDIPNDELGLGWFRYIFLLNGAVGSSTYFWGNLGITWTIPIFAFFYLIAPLLSKIIKNIAWGGVLFIVLYAIGYVCGHYCQFGPNDTISYLNCFSCLKYFALGIIVYFVEKGNYEYIGTLIMAITAIVFFVVRDKVMSYSILFSIIFSMSNKLDLSRLPFKVKKGISALDEYSYTLYLGHGIVFCGLIDKIAMPKYLVVIIAIFGTIILTFTLRKFIEKPIQKFLKKIFLKRQGREVK